MLVDSRPPSIWRDSCESRSKGCFTRKPESLYCGLPTPQDFCGDSYRKGDQIVERDIAEELNVSRSPVREALKELEHQGIVVAKPRVGWFVAKHTEKELREIMEVRTMLELRVFEDLITGDRLDKEDFALLDGHMKKKKG